MVAVVVIVVDAGAVTVSLEGTVLGAFAEVTAGGGAAAGSPSSPVALAATSAAPPMTIASTVPARIAGRRVERSGRGKPLTGSNV